MGSHPLNLALRFALEMSALVALGAFGWERFAGALRWPATIGLPLIAMIAWGTFAVAGDPSRSGGAPVPVPGALRLALELGLFASACAALVALDHRRLALALGVIVVLHYAASWDRIAWLLERRP